MNTLFFVALAVVAWSGLILFFACKLEECNNKRISHVGWDWHESTMDHMVCEPEPIRYYRGDAHPTEGGEQVEMFVAMLDWLDFEIGYYNSEQ